MRQGAMHGAAPAISDQRFVDRLARASGTNFYYSFLFLSRPRRDAIHALYAFCREVDDSVDAATGPDKAVERVAFWRRELEACYAGRPTHPVCRSLASHLARFPIRRSDLEEMIDGVAMDITPRRFRTWEELRVYCYRVASTVGLACLEIFGYTETASREYAVNLGLAFQMTNILRDVRSDAERGRVYLPVVEMERLGCDESALRSDEASPEFVALMRHEIGRARELFRRAERTLPAADRRSLLAARIMGAIYGSILDKIDRRVERVLHGKTGLSRAHKLALATGLFLGDLVEPRRTPPPA